MEVSKRIDEQWRLVNTICIKKWSCLPNVHAPVGDSWKNMSFFCAIQWRHCQKPAEQPQCSCAEILRSDKVRQCQTKWDKIRQCQTRSDKVRQCQTKSKKVRKGQLRSEGMTRSDSQTTPDSVGQSETKSNKVRQGHTVRQTKSDKAIQGQTKSEKGHTRFNAIRREWS